MRKLPGTLAFALAVVAAAPAFASDQTAVMAAVHQFTDGFNKGDTKTALATCADQTSIIDEFAPHEWHGAGACERWMNDYDADAKKNGVTDGVVILGKPRHVDVSGDVAYVVVPADYRYRKMGKPMKETGSLLTIALHRDATGWRMTGWAWTKH